MEMEQEHMCAFGSLLLRACTWGQPTLQGEERCGQASRHIGVWPCKRKGERCLTLLLRHLVQPFVRKEE